MWTTCVNISSCTVCVSLQSSQAETEDYSCPDVFDLCVCECVCVCVCVCVSCSPSALLSPRHQMDPLQIAGDEIKNNSCQISQWSERGERKEEKTTESAAPQVKTDVQWKASLGNFMGVVKWLSWSCQLQTACQRATQAAPPRWSMRGCCAGRGGGGC